MNQSAFVSSPYELNVVRTYREAMFEIVIDNCALREVYEYVRASQHDTMLPYHNPQHCIRTAMRAYELFQLENVDFDLKVLMVACLFHDFGHTGQRPDSKNIDIAVNALWACESVQRALSRRDIKHAERMIRVTEFPFVHEPETIYEKIIRDADLMEGFEPFHLRTILYDLRNELVSVQGEITVAEAVKRQQAFMNAVTMYTESGRRIWQATKLAAILSMHAKATELDQLGLDEVK